MEQLDVFKKSIGTLFCEMQGNKFVIPDYQRPYTWDTEKCETLWQDILDFRDRKEKEYFLGSVVLFRNKNDQLEVIDGQQRLTTLFLLLRALYKKLEDIVNKDKNVIGLMSQIEPCIWDVNKITREVEDNTKFHIESLVAFGDKKDEFHKIIESGKTEENDKSHYSQNFNTFLKKHTEFIENNTNEWYQICSDILTCCIVLSVECKDQETALTIFSTLNDRGMPLTDADVFKGKIYGLRKKDGKEKEFVEKWKKLSGIAEKLDKKIDGLDYVFRVYYHYLRAKDNDFSTSEIAIRKYFDKKENKNHFENENIIDELLLLANFWNYLINDFEDNSIPKIDKETIKYLECLKEYPNDYWKYPVSVFFMCNKDKGDFNASFQKLLKSIVRKFFIEFMKTHTSSAIKHCAYKAYCHIAANKYSELDDCLNVSKDDVKDAWERVYESDKLIKPLILLHANLNSKQKNPVLSGKFQIEHILPKSWQTSNYNGMIENIDKKKYLEKLGNKVAINKKENIDAGNKYFGKKKEIYVKSLIADVKDLSKYKSKLSQSPDDWGGKDIDKREEELKERLNKFFRGEN